MKNIYFLCVLFFLIYWEKYQASVAVQAVEEGLSFISDLTAQLAQGKIEREQLKTEIIQLVRKNTDIKMNQAIKIKNMIAIASLKMKLILSMNFYAEYEEEITKTLQNKIDKIIQKINLLTNKNLDILQGTVMKDLVSVYNYILEDGFNNYFFLYEDYMKILNTMNVVFNSVLSDDRIKNMIITNTDKPEAIFITDIVKIITKLQNEYTTNVNKNMQYKINVGQSRNYLSTVFFRAVDDINKKIDDLLLSESKKDITDNSVQFYDLSLAITRLESILFSKIDLYERNLKEADDIFYKMYFILKKILVQINWIIKSLKSNNSSIAMILSELKKNITNKKINNNLQKASFIKSVSVSSVYFESLIKSLNDFVKKLIHYRDIQIKNEKSISNKINVFEYNLDPDVVLKKLNNISGLIQEDLLQIEKRKNFITNQLNFLYNIALMKNDLAKNISIYETTQYEKDILVNIEKSILEPNLGFHQQIHFPHHGGHGGSGLLHHQRLKSTIKHRNSGHDSHNKIKQHEHVGHNIHKKALKSEINLHKKKENKIHKRKG